MSPEILHAWREQADASDRNSCFVGLVRHRRMTLLLETYLLAGLKEPVQLRRCQGEYFPDFILQGLFSLPFQTQHKTDYPTADPHHSSLIAGFKTALVDPDSHGNR